MTVPVPICYYPTKILLLNQDRAFSENLAKDLIWISSYYFFDKTVLALDFLEKQQATPNDLLKIEAYDSEFPHDALIFQKKALLNHLTSPLRFNTIGVAIIDHYPPDCDGIDACRQMTPRIKKVLSHDELDIAVDAFNDRIIDRFVAKDAKDYIPLLNQAILEAGFKFFQQETASYLYAIENYKQIPEFLNESLFAEFFMAIFQAFQLREFYLVHEEGDFLCVDEKGVLSWLLFRDAKGMEKIYRRIEGLYKDEPDAKTGAWLDKVEKKEWILAFVDQGDHIDEFIPHLYPVDKMDAEGQYFCARVPFNNEVVSFDDLKPFALKEFRNHARS